MVPLPMSAAAAISSTVTAAIPSLPKRSHAALRMRSRVLAFFRSRNPTSVINDHGHNIQPASIDVSANIGEHSHADAPTPHLALSAASAIGAAVRDDPAATRGEPPKGTRA